MAVALLEQCKRAVSRALIWVERLGTIVLWRGYGEGSDAAMLGSLRLELDEPSMFSLALESRAPWSVSSAACEADEMLFTTLPEMPERAVVVPVFSAEQLIFFLYVDNGAQGIPEEVIAGLARLASDADATLQFIAAQRLAARR